MIPRSLLTIIVFFAILISCKKEKDEPKTSNFSSPEEFIVNPDVNNAKNNSGIYIYYGDNPPALVGEYETDGVVTRTSPELYLAMGLPTESTICLFNQTKSGLISFTERVGNIVVGGSGSYITGEGGNFTIWGESVQTGSIAGLPDDCAITVVIIISGQKLTGGNLSAKSLSVITEIKNCPDLDDYVGSWWMCEGDFYLQGPC